MKIMKSEKEILERIEHIKTLSNGYGINERRIKELEWVLKPSKFYQHTVSEQLVAFLEFIEGNKMLEVDLEYEEIVRRFLGN